MELQYFTADQVAELLQLDPRTVRRWLNEGKLPGKRLGTKEWRIAASELHEFMTNKPPAKPPASVKRLPAKRRRSGD